MQLILDPTKKTEVTVGYRMLAALVENVTTPAEVVKTPASKKEMPKKESAPKKEAPVEGVVVEVPDEPKVTRESLIDHIKHNFADNIQPVKDMLDRMGCPKVSEIPEDRLEEAMGLLTEEG